MLLRELGPSQLCHILPKLPKKAANKTKSNLLLHYASCTYYIRKKSIVLRLTLSLSEILSTLRWLGPQQKVLQSQPNWKVGTKSNGVRLYSRVNQPSVKASSFASHIG